MLHSSSSGLLQAALLETMDGALGISGYVCSHYLLSLLVLQLNNFLCRWRWTFIIDASFTAVLAYFGFKYLPDYPGSGTSWLSEEVRLPFILVCEEFVSHLTDQDVIGA